MSGGGSTGQRLTAAAFGEWWRKHGAAVDGGRQESRSVEAGRAAADSVAEEADVDDTAADEAATDAATEGPGAWYVAEDGDVLLRHDAVLLESRDVLAGVDVSLVDVVRLHGMEPLGDESRWAAHVSERSPEYVVRDLTSLRSCHPTAQRQQVERHIQSLIADALALIARRSGGRVFVLGACSSIETGDQIPSRSPADLLILNGLSVSLVRIAAFNDSPNDKGCQLRGIKAGTRGKGFWWPPGDLKEQLFDAQRVAQAIGGIRARCAVLGMTGPRDGRTSPEVVAVVDAGPDFRPGRLGLSSVRAAEVVEPLPAMAGFNRVDLVFALLEFAQSLPIEDCDEMTRWIAWETEV